MAFVHFFSYKVWGHGVEGGRVRVGDGDGGEGGVVPVYKKLFKLAFLYSPPKPTGFYYIICTVYSVNCCPSDLNVTRPEAEIRTRGGRSRGRDSDH